MKKICFVSTSRADYWLLKALLEEIRKDNTYELQIVVSAAMLSPTYGYAAQYVEMDGFHINEKIESLVSGDTPLAISKTMGLSVMGFGEAYARLKPDLLLLPGDRYEMLMAAAAACISKIRIAHFYGGDITKGAYDDEIRNAITQLAHFHFVSNINSYDNLLKLGVSENEVFNYGSPALDSILNVPVLSRANLEAALGVSLGQKSVLLTLHPETKSDNLFAHLDIFLQSIEYLIKAQYTVIITAPNADTCGLSYLEKLENFCRAYNHVCFFKTLGLERYVSLMNIVDFVMGNSSSGLYEVPSFKIPTINIGNRQEGRLKASSIIDVQWSLKSIIQGIKAAQNLDCSRTANPYGDGQSSPKIYGTIKNILQ